MSMRPIDFARDIPFIHDWVHRDYARYWGMQDCSPEQVRDSYAQLCRREGYQVLIGEWSGHHEPLFLLELYHPLLDELAEHYPALESDRGFHLIVAPATTSRPSLTFHILWALGEFAFRDPAVQRIVAEPDIRNEKMLVRCLQAGYTLGDVVHLPDKTAQMVQLTRSAFSALRAEPPPKPAAPLSAAQIRAHLMIGRVKRRLHTVF